MKAFDITTKKLSRAHERGLSLIELMVALTISGVLIFGATQVYVDSRNAYNINENIARLQENARYAMSVLESDIRLAGYWGYQQGSGIVQNSALQTAPAAAPFGAAQICGTNFAIDADNPIHGDNNDYILSASLPMSRQPACDSLSGWNTSAALSADTITIRRASAVQQLNAGNQPVTTNGILQVCSNRVGAQLISNGALCGAVPTLNIDRVANLIVDGYYIDNNSSTRAGMPSLRRKALISAGGAPAFADQEVMPGVEDMQVEFGIENLAVTGVPNRYINPPPGLITVGSAIVAVRVWLLIRSDTPDISYTDNNTYQYGDRAAANGAAVFDLSSGGARRRPYQPSLDPAVGINNLSHFRRMLISRTFQVRNAIQ